MKCVDQPDLFPVLMGPFVKAKIAIAIDYSKEFLCKKKKQRSCQVLKQNNIKNIGLSFAFNQSSEITSNKSSVFLLCNNAIIEILQDMSLHEVQTNSKSHFINVLYLLE